MSKNHRPAKAVGLPRYFRGADIPMRIIRRFARQVAERFQPDKNFGRPKWQQLKQGL
jgi:hypothetical protein